jgi:hypothetical protein
MSLFLFDLLALVQKALHRLLIFLAIGQDFADGLGNEPMLEYAVAEARLWRAPPMRTACPASRPKRATDRHTE